MCSGCSSSSSFFHDPVGYAQAVQQQSLAIRISTSVAKTSLDAARQSGESMVALIDAAASLGKAIGQGGLFDASA